MYISEYHPYIIILSSIIGFVKHVKNSLLPFCDDIYEIRDDKLYFMSSYTIEHLCGNTSYFPTGERNTFQNGLLSGLFSLNLFMNSQRSLLGNSLCPLLSKSKADSPIKDKLYNFPQLCDKASWLGSAGGSGHYTNIKGKQSMYYLNPPCYDIEVENMTAILQTAFLCISAIETIVLDFYQLGLSHGVEMTLV